MESQIPCERLKAQVTIAVQLLLGRFDLFTFKCRFNLKPESCHFFIF